MTAADTAGFTPVDITPAELSGCGVGRVRMLALDVGPGWPRRRVAGIEVHPGLFVHRARRVCDHCDYVEDDDGVCYPGGAAACPRGMWRWQVSAACGRCLVPGMDVMSADAARLMAADLAGVPGVDWAADWATLMETTRRPAAFAAARRVYFRWAAGFFDLAADIGTDGATDVLGVR
jgi:hypothetical protein